jgi:hypothetical protein
MTLQQRYNTKAAALYRDKVRLRVLILALFIGILFIDLDTSISYGFSVSYINDNSD